MKIAYVMSRFPHLPETFILREMEELERLGFDVRLYPLVCQRQEVLHEEARRWMARANRIPWLSGEVIAANAGQCLRRPARYVRLGVGLAWGNRRSTKFLLRSLAVFPRAVVMARRMQAEGVQRVHAHYATHPATAAWIIRRLAGIPYSLTAHAHDIFVPSPMLEPKLRDAQFIATISRFNREFLANRVGEWVRAKTFIVHCGIEPERYIPCNFDFQSYNISHVDDKKYRLLTIGSYQLYKGQRFLVEACRILRERGLPVSCRMIGEGEERVNLEGLIAANGLSGVVKLMGPRTQGEVAQLLTEADCYVQPSVIDPSGKMEGIPVALMEAMACGLPVIATRISGIPELVEDGVTGKLTPPAQANALAEAVQYVIEHPQEASRMRMAGRERVLSEFDLRANVAQLASLFEKAEQGNLPAAC